MRLRRAFTLIELVVVITIIGILAAVAAPKLFNKTGEAKSSATRQSLVALRDALEMYKTENGGTMPAASALATDLKPYLRGAFPVESFTGSATVTAATAPYAVDTSVTGGWLYDASTGEILVNHASGIAW